MTEDEAEACIADYCAGRECDGPLDAVTYAAEQRAFADYERFIYAQVK